MTILTIDPSNSFNAGVCAPKGFYKPFAYPWAFEAYRLQNMMHWMGNVVPMHNDIRDWRTKLDEGSRNLLTQLFRFFVTGDVDVGQAYMDKYQKVFRNEEIRMMLAAFANMEAIHADAYSLLIDSVGMPEVEYKAFKSFEEMVAKHSFVESFSIDSEEDVLFALAVFSAYTEGLQLFSTFAILMSFARGNRPGGAVMTGMNQIVTYSIRDESLHVEYMCRLFRTFLAERPYLWTTKVQKRLYEIQAEMVRLEDMFIDLAYQEGHTPGMHSSEPKKYIRHIANIRARAIGLQPVYSYSNGEAVNLPWIDTMMSSVEHTNFFENRATNYSKGGLLGSWNDVWAQPKAIELQQVAI